MKSRRRGLVYCDRCSKEIFLKHAVIRFPISNSSHYYYFCEKCANSWDKVAGEIGQKYDEMLMKSFDEWITYGKNM